MKIIKKYVITKRRGKLMRIICNGQNQGFPSYKDIVLTQMTVCPCCGLKVQRDYSKGYNPKEDIKQFSGEIKLHTKNKLPPLKKILNKLIYKDEWTIMTQTTLCICGNCGAKWETDEYIYR